MDDDQQFCLRWNNHQSTLISVFDNLLTSQTLVDCTIAAEGKFLKAHKVVLSACSPYFATLLQQQYDKHPILILKDVKYQELTAMMDYMYRGEVNISQDQLAALLKAAESLQIKGLSDNRTGAPKPEHHRGLNIPGSVGGGSSKLSSGYTLEQTKRARVGQSGMDSQDLSASREGSSSPSRRRRKVRRRSIENAMTDIHDNSNSSQMQSNQSALLQQPANLAGAGAITAAAAQIPTSSTALSTGTSVGATGATSGQGSTQQPMTTSVTKKTESVKGTSDAMKTENVQTSNIVGVDEQEIENLKGDKQNHKQKMTPSVATGKDTSDLVIEPKSEYDDDGNDETVEDLTLDDEEMGMDDLDHNAGTSQGGEGSSQGYAPWQHDRSQDELLLTTQDAQQRDPQGYLPISSNIFIANDNTMSSCPNTSAITATNSNMAITNLVTTPSTTIDYTNSNHTSTTTSTMNHHHRHHLHQQLSFDNCMLGEEQYTCPQCFRTYRRHGTLRRHLRQECGKGKSMVCSVCGHRTKRADHLRQHVRKKHPEIAMRSLFRRSPSQHRLMQAHHTATTSILQQQLQLHDAVSAAVANAAKLNIKPLGKITGTGIGIGIPVANNTSPTSTKSVKNIGRRRSSIESEEVVDLDKVDDIDDDNADHQPTQQQLEHCVGSSINSNYFQQQLQQQAMQQLQIQQQYQHQQQQAEVLATTEVNNVLVSNSSSCADDEFSYNC
ncbi:longitudinals lacking protein, isoforms A/B/D/L-like [Teleopsis dalmanni]|uniref:longitudinals lacking protein, isoforms A/B/D/L-like n=1 Tax=Teleopsis dalmanni TaxID=139649 RepID=UPI0018CDE46A|nr:longitudinals lacking protein, isoforms A/B/D/L-like [Teleopsis dalmanni]XP_037956225.1 longitudinals lacking protein, isoforms A/B/D/L-like [Teleopsis dalmanni]XP_037956226.1 longitudinals lacking protein, isoforms A/B/D/L-like [Teleopsis dalmanni]XP_037956227.1 longitudinals lacking protein, isoforms A/B/D/L-like [Teleopsis dalmanni]XP_037956228.1 longitudinals lacking protein, isoforms A/B/D/L-like [Teleopsis dalmanni]XP_037956229.1 longitudinals lacking protein, isoforms A/B/D/L-like [T